METLQTRIQLAHVKGAEIAYLYNRESFDLLKIERSTFDSAQRIEVGDILEYDGRKYKVERINFRMEAHLYRANNEVGINMYSPTDQSDFNCTINVYVDNL